MTESEHDPLEATRPTLDRRDAPDALRPDLDERDEHPSPPDEEAEPPVTPRESG